MQHCSSSEIYMPKIVASGITHYDFTDQRFQSCLRFLEGTQALGIPVYLADSSPHHIRQQLMERTLGGVVHVTGSYTEKKIRALEAALATGAKAIIITEMEKDGLVPYLEAICDPIHRDKADLVIPQRTDASWTSYPKEFEIERFALEQIQWFTGQYLDTMLGAFAIHRDEAPRFLACQEPMWTWLHVPRFQMIQEKPDRVVGVPIDFLYSPAQREAEEGNPAFRLKRLEQLAYSLIRPLQVVYDGAK